MNGDAAAAASSLPWAGAPEAAGGVLARCPVCAWRYRVHQDASTVCDGCRREIHFHVFQPRTSGLVSPDPLPAAGGTPCAAHGANLAVDACARCGVFMCAVCRTSLGGAGYCPGCVDRMASDEGGLRRFVSGAFLWGTLAFHLGLLGFLGPAPFGLVVAIVGWFRHRRRPVAGEGWRLAVGFALSALWTALFVAAIVSAITVNHG